MDMKEFMEMMEKNRRIKEALTKMDFSEFVASRGKGDCLNKLKEVRKNTIPLKTVPCSDEDIPIGGSKIGGYPDLPESIPYPTFSGYTETRILNGSCTRYEESAMQLALQLDLSDAAPFDRDHKLPESGFLYIFWSGEFPLVNNKYCTFDFDSDNTSPYKIIYFNGDKSQLKRTAPPCPYYSNLDAPLKVKKITIDECRYEYDKSKLENIIYSPNDATDIADKLSDDYEMWEINGHKLFGYHTGSMNVSDPPKGYINLFQFSYHVGCIWDIYWFISEEALASLDFDRSYISCDMD